MPGNRTGFFSGLGIPHAQSTLGGQDDAFAVGTESNGTTQARYGPRLEDAILLAGLRVDDAADRVAVVAPRDRRKTLAVRAEIEPRIVPDAAHAVLGQVRQLTDSL